MSLSQVDLGPDQVRKYALYVKREETIENNLGVNYKVKMLRVLVMIWLHSILSQNMKCPLQVSHQIKHVDCHWHMAAMHGKLTSLMSCGKSITFHFLFFLKVHYKAITMIKISHVFFPLICYNCGHLAITFPRTYYFFLLQEFDKGWLAAWKVTNV